MTQLIGRRLAQLVPILIGVSFINFALLNLLPGNIAYAIGVLGGLIGGALFSWAGGNGIGHFGLRSMFVAFVGAVLLLVIVGLLSGRRNRHY